MKNITKAALAFALIFCLAVSFAACNDNDEIGVIYGTDTNGETLTDTNGDPITENPSDTTDTESTENDNGNISNAGANTEDGWGELIPPNN